MHKLNQVVRTVLLVLLLSFIPGKSDKEFYMPAEWEEQGAAWVGWELFGPFNQPSLDVIKSLIPFVKVKVVAESDYSARVAKEYLQMQGVDSAKVEFMVIRDNRVWLRDHGATFLINKEKKLGVANFVWTHYGIRDWLEWVTDDKSKVESTYRQVLKKTGQVDSIMGIRENAAIRSTYISMEGGSIEVNGKGVLLLNETVTLQRNKNKSRSFIETEFKRLLGIKKIIWLKEGLADDPHIIRPITENYIGFGTGGHTDEFVRFADASTILLAWVDESEKDSHPLNTINFERMQENLRILENATDLDGKPFKIIKVPLPDPIVKKVVITNYQKHEWDDAILSNWLGRDAGFKAGDSVWRVAAASYLNYFVSNGVVLLPNYTKYGSSQEKENQIKKIFSEAFPGRQLIFLDVMSLNYEGGGIHCITQQQPSAQ